MAKSIPVHPDDLDGNAVGLPTLLSIGQIPRPGPVPGRHVHPTWELVLYASGQGELEVGPWRVPFGPGSLVCLPPHIPHVEHCPAGYVNWFLAARNLGRGQLGSDPVPVFHDQDGRLAALVGEIHREHQLREDGWEEACDRLFGVLLIRLRRRRRAPAHLAVERLKRILAERLHDPDLSIAAAMAGAGLARDHLRRLFAAATGLTPARWLARLRVEQARRLLAHGGYSVAEVGELVGLPDPFHFSRLFRRVAGQPPSALRGRTPARPADG
jgi:AraC-like DNA-binding protein